MRLSFRFSATLAGVVCLAGGCMAAASNPILPGRQALELYKRSVQLMESSAVAIPELARAGAPVTENARQALLTLERSSGQPTTLTYTFLINLKAFLSLADAVPKPHPFPEEARKQMAELRDACFRIEAHFRGLLEQREAQARGADRDNLRRYAEANSTLPPAAAGRPRVVFLGDSITDAWRLNEYFPDRDFVNRGISGQITGEMLGRMKADVIDLKPAAMVLLAGTNDLARGVAVSTIQNNFTMIADLADKHGIKPIFTSILPVSDYNKAANPMYERTPARPPATIKTLNNWLQDFCRKRGYAYVDYWSKTVDQAGFLQASLAEDGLHPNPAGYRIMAPLVLEAIGKAVAPAPATQQPKKRRFPF